MINKYNNPRLHNTVLTGPGMAHPRNPHVVIGSEEKGFIQGDLMDANAVMETIDQKTAELVDSAPEALDTFKELAAALNDDSNFATTVVNAINQKQDTLVSGENIKTINGSSILGEGNIEQQQADWNLTNTSAVDYINNKPDVALKSDIYTTICDANGHDYVEIGGIKWATMNIGASSVTDAGLYFQWGDTQGYTASQVGTDKVFNWESYKYGNGTSNPGNAGMTKYNSTDNKTVLELSDDAAAANWRGTWRMPTREDFITLGASVNIQWSSDYQNSGVAGMVLTDKTDSSKVLFFPAGGRAVSSGLLNVGNNGNGCTYNTSTIGAYNTRRNIDLDIYTGMRAWDGADVDRYIGHMVRGVLVERTVSNFPTTTDLATVATTGDYTDLLNTPTIPTVPTNVSSFNNDAGYLTSHQDISGKEDKTVIESASGTTLSPSVNKYYRFSGAVNTLTVTLPVPTDSTHVASVILYFTAGNNPNVTITCPSDVYYSDGFEIEADTTYEVNCLWNGASWVVASVTIIVE